MRFRLVTLLTAFALSLFTLSGASSALAAPALAGTVVTVPFNNGNPITVGPATIHSPAAVLPATVSSVSINFTDPLGDWANPANAGGTFIFGVEYSTDGGATWVTLAGNGIGQPVGSWFRGQVGQMPRAGISSEALQPAYGMPVRVFASSTNQIRVGASATITT